MTIKDLDNVINTDCKFFIVENGELYSINRESALTMTIYSDYVIADICVTGIDVIEISLKMQPIKKETVSHGTA